MKQMIARMTAVVEIKHLNYDCGENDYRLVDDTRFTIRYGNKGSIGRLSELNPSQILQGQSGVGMLTVISPEQLGEDFLNEGLAHIELLGEVIATCKFDEYQVEEVSLP